MTNTLCRLTPSRPERDRHRRQSVRAHPATRVRPRKGPISWTATAAHFERPAGAAAASHTGAERTRPSSDFCAMPAAKAAGVRPPHGRTDDCEPILLMCGRKGVQWMFDGGIVPQGSRVHQRRRVPARKRSMPITAKPANSRNIAGPPRVPRTSPPEVGPRKLPIVETECAPK